MLPDSLAFTRDTSNKLSELTNNYIRNIINRDTADVFVLYSHCILLLCAKDLLLLHAIRISLPQRFKRVSKLEALSITA